MQPILCAWLGEDDLNADGIGWQGPIAQSIRERRYRSLVLLSDASKARTKRYLKWLKQQVRIDVDLHHFEGIEQANFAQLFEITRGVVSKLCENHKDEHPNLVFNISSGTPLTGAIWVILAKFHFDAEIIRTSVDLGVETIDAPDALVGSELSTRTQARDKKIEKILAEKHVSFNLLEDYALDDPGMKSTISIARRAAPHNVGILIMGESGTGRTHLAKAIHYASLRAEQPVAVIDPRGKSVEDLRRELFGHVRHKKHPTESVGQFSSCNGGTIILERLEQIPMPVQIDLLRAMASKNFRKVGGDEDIPFDLRFIGTVQGEINQLVANGEVHEALYLRLSVALIRIPPLRERLEDFDRLIASLWEETNAAFGSVPKSLTEKAIAALKEYPWPGNIRELRAILARMILWSDADEVNENDVESALSMSRPAQTKYVSFDLLEQQEVSKVRFYEGFSIEEHLDAISRVYVMAALQQANNSKTIAADLLGLNSYQSVTNWIKRLKIKEHNM